MSDSSSVVTALGNACASFTATGIDALALGPVDARAVVRASQHVVVRLQPARAQLLVEAPNGEMGLAYRVDGADVPAQLGEAAAAFVTVAVALLSAVARANLVRMLDSGAGSLSVVVSRDDGCAALMLDDGGAEPKVLVKLEPDVGTVH